MHLPTFAARLAFTFLAVAFLPLCGCQRGAAPDFSSDTEKLSADHQEQIRQQLATLFGTPANPRFQVLAEEQDEEAEEPQLVDLVDPLRLQHGAQVFERRCAGCHGITGDGLGEAAEFLQPKPRDYRRGVFKFTSTPYGAKPNRADLIRVIKRGAKGTSMPAFPFLPEDELRDVVDYVVMLSYRGELEFQVAQIVEVDYDEGDEIDPYEFYDTLDVIHRRWQDAQHQGVLPVSAQPKYSDESILAGRKAFLSKGCSKCHGDDFRGQTIWLSKEFLAAQADKPEAEREKINYDAWGDPAPAADLTAGMLHGGRRPIDIYRRLHTGINGTPMPAFDKALAEEPETLWHLVHYVVSVVEKRQVPGIEDVVADPAAPESGE